MTSWGDSGVPQPKLERTQTEKPHLRDTLRSQFRAVMKALTRAAPAPAPRKRREKTEVSGGFRLTAFALLRRVIKNPFLAAVVPSWDTFTWLRIWDYNDAATASYLDHSAAENGSHSDLSLHL